MLGAHMLEVCPSLTTSTPRIEVHPLGIGGREDPVRMVFQADPGPGVVVSLADVRDRFRLTANVVDLVDARGEPAAPAGRAGGLEAAPRLHHQRRVVAAGRRRAPHRAVDRRRARRVPRAGPHRPRRACSPSRTARRSTGSSASLQWNQAYYRLAGGL
ncbi:hypothetical protein GCM10025868_00840 [Angustibacter aerolatus]|uniref:L-arabinose isomerase C-terminal domain-containing protein n=1 Tax=Angustibacter aerolatus TaxID=1162965 RepID=A0ABQ6JBL0_9ACTN|nr:hypothetical protein GCM10025868_00840 [Angustibacter aerolatus]